MASFSRLSNEPHQRSLSDPADTLLCGLCRFCWSKMRWCTSRCCMLMREVAVDLAARESLQSDSTDELNTLKRAHIALQNDLKENIKSNSAKDETINKMKVELEALHELTYTLRQLIANWVDKELQDKMAPFVGPKAALCEKLAKERLGDNDSKSKEEMKPVASIKKQIVKPKGFKAIMADHQRQSAPAAGSVLKHIEQTVKQRKARADSMKAARFAKKKVVVTKTSQQQQLSDSAGSDLDGEDTSTSPGGMRTVSQLHLATQAATTTAGEQQMDADDNVNHHD